MPTKQEAKPKTSKPAKAPTPGQDIQQLFALRGKKRDLEAAIKDLEGQISLIEEQINLQQEALARFQEQIDIANGVYSATISVADAIAALQAALTGSGGGG